MRITACLILIACALIGPATAAEQSPDTSALAAIDDQAFDAQFQCPETLASDDERIDVNATITALADKTAAHLRVLLVEDVVRYPGLNGRRLHHHVVRSIVADVGVSLAKGASKSIKSSVAVDELRRKLAENLERVNKEDPFPTDERPLDLKRLKIVVLLQDEQSKEILDAVQADVPEKRTK